MDNNDPLLFRILDLIKLADLTVIDDVSLIRTIRINAAQNVHQGRLSRSVFPYQSMDLAFLHFQIHVVKRFNAGEGFGNIFHLK